MTDEMIRRLRDFERVWSRVSQDAPKPVTPQPTPCRCSKAIRFNPNNRRA